MNWYLHACPVCGGDMHDDVDDPGWVSCFACARSFPMAEVVRPREPTALASARRERAGEAAMTEQETAEPPAA
ncbi:MAG TPA: hypothetical protein VFC51_10910 [Chloroflexota bacterium]|nr:hypothetical protein [Chloroflexota bacterium]